MSVVHCDISCRNILVFPGWSAKIGDFGGSKIDDEEPLDVTEEIRYELPLRGRKWEDRPIIKRELFAFGSALYEIMAWKMPFDKLKDEEVEKNYAEEKFPDITGLPVGDVIRRCWTEKFETAEDVQIALEAFKTNLDTAERQRAGEEKDKQLPGTNIFEDVIAARDSRGVIVSTTGGLISATRFASQTGTTHWEGRMSGATLQQRGRWISNTVRRKIKEVPDLVEAGFKDCYGSRETAM
jgi:hypothetical protein